MTTLNPWVLNLLEMAKSFPTHIPKRNYQLIRTLLLTVVDLIIVGTSYYLSFVLRLESFDLGEYTYTASVSLIVYLFVHAAILNSLGMYQQVWKYANLSSAVLIGYSTLVAAILSSIICVFFDFDKTIPRSVPFIFWLISSFQIALVKFTWRGLHSIQAALKKEGHARCLIYGAGASGELLMRHIKSNRRFPFEIVGFIDDDTNKMNQRIHGVAILGTGKDLKKLAAEKKADTILIAINSTPGKIIRDIVAKCIAYGLKPLISPQIADSLEADIYRPRKVDVADLLRRAKKSTDKQKICQFYESKSVLITGAGGSIGSEICRQIVKLKPTKLILVDMCEFNLYRIQDEIEKISDGSTETSILMGSITDREFVRQTFRKHRPEIVFHAAAYKHVSLVESNTVQSISNNVFGTQIVSEAALEFGSKNFLLVSSDKAVNPVGVMGQTKRVCELLIQKMQTNYGNSCKFCAVRFGNVLGSSGSVIPKFLEQISSGGPVTVTHPEMKRYFMLVQEAVELVLESVIMTKGGEVFVLNMGDPINIYGMARQLVVLAGKRIGEDIDIVFTGIRDGEKLFEELMYDGFEEKTEHEDIFITKAKSVDREFIADLCAELQIACSDFDEKKSRLLLKSLCSGKSLQSPILHPQIKNIHPTFLREEAL